jgi:hypothetical protein
MIKLQSQTTTNTYENVLATKGLNNNLYKAWAGKNTSHLLT